MLQQEIKGRNEQIDFAKAIGICLVILGHTFGGGLFALKTYHMPFFFFVSGFLMDDKESIGLFLKKRIFRLYIPFLLYEIFLLCIHNFLYHLEVVSNLLYFPQDFFRQFIHIICFDNCEILLAPIWFVTVLFFAGIVSRLLLSFLMWNSIHKKERVLLAAIFVLSICLIYGGMLNGRYGKLNVSCSYNCSQVINITMVAAGYILIGYLCKYFKTLFLAKKSIWKQMIIIIPFIGVILLERKTRLISDMRSNRYTYISLAPFFALIGILMIFLAAQYVLWITDRGNLKRIKLLISYIGQHTFAIMCLHPLAFKLIGLIQVNFFGYDKQLLLDWGVVGRDVWWLLLDCMAGILIPLAGNFCLKKVLIFMHMDCNLRYKGID